MSAPSVHVVPVTLSLRAAVCALRVKPGQGDYAGDPAFNLASALDDPLSEAMAVLADEEVIGFYRLDFSPSAIIGRSLGAPGVALRAFCIDARRQGRGLGALAAIAMCADVERRHPDRRLLILLVHCCNPAGIATYRRAGFVDTGTLFGGGRAGPQHLMVRALGSDGAAAMGQCRDG